MLHFLNRDCQKTVLIVFSGGVYIGESSAALRRFFLRQQPDIEPVHALLKDKILKCRERLDKRGEQEHGSDTAGIYRHSRVHEHINDHQKQRVPQVRMKLHIAER